VATSQSRISYAANDYSKNTGNGKEGISVDVNYMCIYIQGFSFKLTSFPQSDMAILPFGAERAPYFQPTLSNW
jgi:hypothetical protein